MRSDFLVAALLSLTLLPAAFAQEAPSPGGPPPATGAPAKDGFITNLVKNDCMLAEDKVPQTIKNFTQEKNLPLTIGILLDTSGSQMNVLPLEQQSGATFLRNVL